MSNLRLFASNMASYITDGERFWGEKRLDPPLPIYTKETDPLERRAMKLLSKKIGWKKYRQLRKKGYFEEKSKYGIIRFYLDDYGGASLIKREKIGKREIVIEQKLCVQSMVKDLPRGDVILSRWMEWKVNEDIFMDTANFTSNFCQIDDTNINEEKLC